MSHTNPLECYKSLHIQQENFSVAVEIEKIYQLHKETGAIANFIGLCKSNDHTVTALEIEHYPIMAETDLAHLATLVCQRWSLYALTIIHRYGFIPIGEQIVFVATASKHRQDAFFALNFIMDFLKTNVAFWKKEHYNNDYPPKWILPRKEDIESYQSW